MDFLVYSRATAAARTSEDDPELDERHWQYMDGFAGAFTARGPTLGPDRETWTGSLHVVDLPDLDAARAFVEDEPYHRAGLFEDDLVRRFADLLGRTMWEFEGGGDQPRFLVLASPAPGVDPLEPVPAADLPSELRDGLVMYGQLLSADGAPAGVALAAQAPDRAALERLLAQERTGLAGLELELHDWEFGGRR